MNVVFEVDRTKKVKVAEETVNTIESKDPVDGLVNTPVADVPVKDKGIDEKARLQGILTDAGIDFSKQLGVAKLQALVDGIPVAE